MTREAILEQIYKLIASVRTNGAYPAESFVKDILTSFEKEIREDDRELLEAISKIDRLVSSDTGFEADLLFSSGKSKSIDQRVARDWAEIIVQTYLITHKLLHSCCGGEKANKRLKSLSTKEETPMTEPQLSAQVNEATKAFYDSKPIYNQKDVNKMLADERKKVLSEVEEWVENNEYSRPDHIEGFAGIVDTDDLQDKLNQLKGEGK